MKLIDYFKNKSQIEINDPEPKYYDKTYDEPILSEEDMKEKRFLENVSKDYVYKDCVQKYSSESSDLFYYPEYTDEMQLLFNEDYLKTQIIHLLYELDPSIINMKVVIKNTAGLYNAYHPDYMYIRTRHRLDKMFISVDVTWVDGKSICEVRNALYSLLCNHFNSIDIPKKYYYYNLYCNRTFSDTLILRTARKYADCISKDLPINITNIKCYKLGGVSLYSLAIDELNSMNFVE